MSELLKRTTDPLHLPYIGKDKDGDDYIDTIPIEATSSVPGTGTLQDAAEANGNGVDFVVDGYGSVLLQVTGTFSATITFYGSVDGTNFVIMNWGKVCVTSIPGIYQFECSGLQKVRAVINNYASGAITVVGRALPGSCGQSVMQLSKNTTELLGQQTTIAPITGTKTATSTAAEAFAGASVLLNRKKLIIKNEDAVLRFRVGAVDITQDKGFTVEPKSFVEFVFDPDTYIPIYIIAESADLEVEVYEE